MELRDTAVLMMSDRWQDRLKAEYWQVRCRLVHLEGWLCQASFDNETRKRLLEQHRAMLLYLAALNGRITRLRLWEFIEKD